MHLGASCPLGGWSRMERQVDVAHLAGSSILLIHPGSDDPATRNTTQRGGMVTSRVSYARRAPVSTERCDWDRAGRQDGLFNHPRRGQHPGPQPSGPRSPTGRGGCPKPSVCTFESCRGYLAGDARVAERPLRTRERESSTLSAGSLQSSRSGSRLEDAGRPTQSGPLFSCHGVHRDGKPRQCRTRSTPT